MKNYEHSDASLARLVSAVDDSNKSEAPSHDSLQWATHELELVNGCPACGQRKCVPLHHDLQDHIFAAAGDRWNLWSCTACACAFLNPRPTTATIGRAYATYYTHASHNGASRKQSLAAWLRRALANGYRNNIYATKLKPSLGVVGPATAHLSRAFRNAIQNEAPGLAGVRPSRQGESLILDVGCGSGLMLQRARDAGWRVMGIEPDEAAAKAAASRGVDVVAAHLTDLPSSFDSTFERITLSHVIEHVHDPLYMLKRCKELLTPDGVLWLETPNLCSAGHAEFGADWRGLEPPRHLVLFSAQAMTELLHKAGFTTVDYAAPRDVWAYMSEQSTRIREKRLADAQRLGLKAHDHSRARPNHPAQRAAAVRRLVAEDPGESEFLTLTARL